MMKKNAKIVAIDEHGKMEVIVRFRSKRYELTKGETKAVATAAAESVADAIRKLPFVHYGPSNTVVSL